MATICQEQVKPFYFSGDCLYSTATKYEGAPRWEEFSTTWEMAGSEADLLILPQLHKVMVSDMSPAQVENSCQLMGCQLLECLSRLFPYISLVRAVPIGLLQWSSHRVPCLPSFTHNSSCVLDQNDPIHQLCNCHTLAYKP